MSFASLSLLLAASASLSQAGTRHIAIATVQIVEAEEIRFADAGRTEMVRQPVSRATQKRVRDQMPLVEFY